MGNGGRYQQLVGRAGHLTAIGELLADYRVVTLCGPGGVGKTRLAEQVATDLVAAGEAEVVIVELAAVDEPALLGHSIAAALDLRAPGDPSAAGYLAEHLVHRDLTLVLDNCEHLVDAVADLVAAVIARCRGVRVVATSQSPLGIAAEVVHPVEPLEVPGEDWRLDDAAVPGALEMFVLRARAAVPTFELTHENVQHVSTIVRQLEGMPLAIELAAARMRLLSPQALAERLGTSYAVLGEGYREAPQRHQSVTASIRWTADLCSGPELDLWARLSVFVGGFDLADVEMICAGDGIEHGEILAVLSGLLDKSVVSRTDDAGDRFRMLETLREYGAVLLAERGSAEHWKDRHLGRFAALAEELRTTWVGPDQVRWLQRIDLEEPNLRAALEHALRSPDSAPTALQMCFALKAYWASEGKSAEARYWMDRALASGAGTDRERLLVYAMSASFALRLADREHAREMALRGAELVGGAQDQVALGSLAIAQGQVGIWDLDLAEAPDRLREAVRLLRSAPTSYEFSAALVVSGIIFTQIGLNDEAFALLSEAVALGEETGEGVARAYAQVWLALHASFSADVSGAEALLRSALGLLWERRDQIGIAMLLEASAHRAYLRGEPTRCGLLLGAAAGQWRRMDLKVEQIMPGAQADRFAYRASVPEKHPEEYARGAATTTEEAVRIAFDLDSGRPADDADALAPAAGPASAAEGLAPLSRREAEVARLVADGLSNREIATELFISERTAQGHVQSALRKLDFGSRSQIAAWVVRITG